MKISALILSILVSCFFSGLTFAEETDTQAAPQDQAGSPDGGMMGGKGMMGKGMMGKGMMMGMMDNTKIVATSDGGIVVLQGPKLTKYDAQLNLIGEAELKKPKKGEHDHGAPAEEASPEPSVAA